VAILGWGRQVTRQVLRSRINSRAERGLARAGPSTRRGRTTVVAPTTVGTSRDIADRFAKRFADYTPAQLAQHAKVTKEAARLWLGAERCINLKDALQLVRSEFPGARAWLESEMGERAGYESPEEISKLIGLLQKRLT